MDTRFNWLVRLAMLLFALALMAFLLVPMTGAQGQANPGGGNPVGKSKADKVISSHAAVSASEHEKVLKYWTKERIKQAKPAKMPSLPGGPSKTPPGGSEMKTPQPEGRPLTIPGMLPEDKKQVSPTSSSSPTPTSHYSYPYPYTSGMVQDPYRTAYPNRTFGRVFFVDAVTGQKSYCSGTVVRSENKSVVWTAGHCVHGGKGSRPHTNWMFMPAYKDMKAPYGKWTAKRLATTKQWAGQSNFRFGLGAAVVNTSSTGGKLANRVGGLGIAFNQAYNQNWKSTGYPMMYPFDGTKMWRCTAPTGTIDYSYNVPGPATMGIGCNMNGGASGGGWAIGLDGGTTARIASVNSYKYYDTQPNAIYGPYQGTVAAQLYNFARKL